GGIAKKVSELGKVIDKVSLIKLVEEYKKVYPVSFILDFFGIKRSTFYRWKVEGEKPKKRDEVVEKIELICMGNQFIYGYRTITRLLKQRDN
ncbi:hypothetical protein QOZ23_32830, partial [Pseudomonas aeruginosa]